MSLSFQHLGFVGLGSQGAPMAMQMLNLGVPMSLWARREATLEGFVDTAAQVAPSLAALAQRCDYLAICVVDDAGVRDVCDIVIPEMNAGGVIVIHSTIHPKLCRELAVEAAQRDLVLVDAPVSGGGPAAEAGQLTMMLGAPDDQVAALSGVFAPFAGDVFHLGQVGAGQQAKLINNAMMAANLAIAQHGLDAGASLGIDRDALVALLKSGTARSFSMEVAGRMQDPTAFKHGAALLGKDVELLTDLLADDATMAIRETAARFINRALSETRL
jgi:3-hydroxyisobutyrate dehydrogenase